MPELKGNNHGSYDLPSKIPAHAIFWCTYFGFGLDAFCVKFSLHAVKDYIFHHLYIKSFKINKMFEKSLC